MHKWFLLSLLLLPLPMAAQFDFPVLAGRAAAMGGAAVALPDHVSALDNIAGMARLQSTSVALAYQQQFLMQGMGYASAAAAVPVGFGAFAFSAVHYGNSDYNEQMLSLAYALPLGKQLSLGAAFHYLHASTSDPYYDPQHLLTFSVALQYAPSDKLTVGFKAYNPSAVALQTASQLYVPARFNLGASYWLADELLAVVEVEKSLYDDASLRCGLEYVFFDFYAVRMGFSTAPVCYTFGLGMQRQHLGVDLVAQYHSVLGMSPLLALSYRF